MTDNSDPPDSLIISSETQQSIDPVKPLLVTLVLAITLSGILLHSTWLEIPGAIVLSLLSLWFLSPYLINKLQQIFLLLCKEPAIKVITVVVAAIAWLHIGGFNQSALKWLYKIGLLAEQPNWDAIGAVGQILVAVLALSLAYIPEP